MMIAFRKSYGYLLILLAVLLSGCYSVRYYEMKSGKRHYEMGYYRKALEEFIPAAMDGNPEAQYTVGYMYYYGYGVSQDTDIAYIYIRRAADQGYPRAQLALQLMMEQDATPRKRTYRDYLKRMK